jgi:hypothetical protein
MIPVNFVLIFKTSLFILNLKVFTNEKKGGLTVVSFDRYRFKLISRKLSNKLVLAPSCERPRTSVFVI